jgi:cyclopropane fatty-acyl-phospholipid synthase-like methyltransferase
MAHYDLGNDFYKIWLDPSMSYSAALYARADDGSLQAAQHAKYRRILASPHGPPGPALARNRLWLGRLCRNGDGRRAWLSPA